MPVRSPYALAALLLLAPLAASAQTPCVGGMAGAYACNEVDLLARVTLAQLGAPTGSACGPYSQLCAAELWGWVDPMTAQEYAVVAVANGTVFVDVTVPTAPVVVGRLPTATGTTNWRTLRVYNNHVFIGSEASGHGIQVFDLTRLRGVTPPQTFTADARYTGVSNTHTLDINEATGFLYAVGTNTCGGGLHMVNIQNPLVPVQAGCYAADGYTHEAQCLVYDGPDADYTGRELCVAYQGSGSDQQNGQVSFIDVTNKSAPVLISTAFYPNDGYSHQGWFTADKRHLLVNDEFDEANPGTRTIVLNVEDLDAPAFDFNYFGTRPTYAHNLYVVGGLAYESNYTSGLHILDVSDVDQNTFTEVGFFDTFRASDALSYAGQWMNYPFSPNGIVLATDGVDGLFILDFTGLNPTASADDEVPADAFALGAAYPNPFAASATLPLTVGTAQHVRAEAFDVLGRRVAVLFDGPLAAGATTRLVLDGAALPAGRYVVRVVGETFAETRQLSLVK